MAEPAYRQAGWKTQRMCYVYAISSEIRNYIYVGLTNDLNRRLNEHNRGYNRTTKPYRPYKLILAEKFESRVEARIKEEYLKSGTGKEYLKQLIK